MTPLAWYINKQKPSHSSEIAQISISNEFLRTLVKETTPNIQTNITLQRFIISKTDNLYIKIPLLKLKNKFIVVENPTIIVIRGK